MNVLEKYLATRPVRKVAKGEIIVIQNEEPVTGYALKKGIVKLCNVTKSGTEKSLSFIDVNGLFPLCWLFSKTKCALYYYEAHTDCELWIVNKKHFMEQVDADVTLACHLMNQYVETCIADTLQCNALAQTKASAKLAEMLRHLCLRYGHDVLVDHVRINIPLTQQELANVVGLTRETTVIELNKLKRQNIIEVTRKYYTVNTALLNDTIDDEYNPGIIWSNATA